MTRRPPPERPGMLTGLARSALDDIHAKLIDEAWFARPRAERQALYQDLRALYGRDPEPPRGWAQMDWTDRLNAEPPSRAIDEGPEIER